MDSDDFELFCGGVCSGIAEQADIPEEAAAVLAVEDGDEIVLAAVTQDKVDQMTERLFHFAQSAMAMASRVNWSPDSSPTAQSWMVVAVTREQPAFFAVKRDEEEQWWRVGPAEAPWFALATASALRGVFDGKPLPPLNEVRDRRLFKRPREEPLPPL